MLNYLHKNSGRNFEFLVDLDTGVKKTTGKWEMGRDWEDWVEEKQSPSATCPVVALTETFEDRGSFQVMDCAVWWLAPLW